MATTSLTGVDGEKGQVSKSVQQVWSKPMSKPIFNNRVHISQLDTISGSRKEEKCKLVQHQFHQKWASSLKGAIRQTFLCWLISDFLGSTHGDNGFRCLCCKYLIAHMKDHYPFFWDVVSKVQSHGNCFQAILPCQINAVHAVLVRCTHRLVSSAVLYMYTPVFLWKWKACIS